jgi:4-amino-4-deoxy-L-arabinose transferase-like glycosyltransferase
MRTIGITKNPFLIFLPFLVLFVVLILIYHTNGNYGDEFQYRLYSNNLIHGFYSPSPPNIDLNVGPGYSIILIPFVALRLPLISISLLNAIFYYLSIIILFKALCLIISFRKALVFCLFWACYYYSYKEMYSMQPETFTSFLISLLVYYILKTFNPDYNLGSKRYIYMSGFIFGYLILTKIIFGYVLVFLFIGNLLLWIFRRKAINYRKGLFVLLIAFAITAPYLIYTYHLTSRILFFGTSGGNNLYWMSTPYSNEYGDWVGFDYLYINSLKNRIPDTYDSLKAHHEKDFEEISKYSGIEKDDAFKRIAINNIKSHPFKFIQNCFSNIGRMLFDFPYSYSIQRYNNLFKLPYNGIIVVLILFCIIPTLINWRDILFSIRFLLFIAFLYLGGSILGSAEMRMFVKIIPIVLLWIAFVIQKCIIIKLKFNKK